jgi:hypothetical protein
MDCTEAHDRILSADSAESRDAELAAHLQTCGACHAIAARLGRLEAAARELPSAPDSQITKQAFLASLALQPAVALPGISRYRILPWPTTTTFAIRRMAMAASVVLATGLVFWSVWFHGVQKAAAADVVVGRLVDFDVRLGSVDSPQERQQLYTTEAPTLEKTVGQLPTGDQALARKLMDTGASLAQSSDPLDDAEQFADVADVLLDHMTAAANAGKAADVERLTRYYGRLSDEGFARRLDKVHRAESGTDAHPGRLSRLIRRDEAMLARLDKLPDQAPERTRKQIRKALKRAGHPHHRPMTRQSTDTPATTDSSAE